MEPDVHQSNRNDKSPQRRPGNSQFQLPFIADKSCRQSDQASVFTGINQITNEKCVIKRYNLHKENDSFKREIEVLSKNYISQNEEGTDVGLLPQLNGFSFGFDGRRGEVMISNCGKDL